jgi:hypothetical protein
MLGVAFPLEFASVALGQIHDDPVVRQSVGNQADRDIYDNS